MSDKISNYPGTSLSEQDIRQGKVLSLHDKMPADFSWDTGIAIGRYLAGLKDGILLGSHCKHCHKTVVPPRTVCEWCFNPMDHFLPLSDSGIVNTFSLCYVTWDVQRIKEPETPAVIDIDGASPLHGIMHKLGEVDPGEISIGMRVKAVWKSAEQREGAITDILYFKPNSE
ncbi:MAG TPA: Zn-ribbon domain-containing OB-fold protein [Anaerolineales bacterium]|nr:Zn-ribbon domain-containing OB-fold protein [Anaerolineales bacterium]